MSKTIFLSTVSNEFGDVRRQLANFGRRTHKLDIRHQEDFANPGVVTLRMLEEEVCKSDYVVHLIGLEAGWVPSRQQVEDFLARHPGFQTRFPDIAADALQGLISATQWEAWLGLYFDKTASGQLRRVFSYELEETLPLGSRQQIHSQRLSACE